VCIIDCGRVVVDGALDKLKKNCRRINLIFKEDIPLPVYELAGVVIHSSLMAIDGAVFLSFSFLMTMVARNG